MGFEENIKQVLEDYTVPYNSADWDQLEKSLDSTSSKWTLSTGLFYGVLLTAALTFTAFLWYMSEGNDSAGVIDQQKVATINEDATQNNDQNDQPNNGPSGSSIPPIEDNNGVDSADEYPNNGDRGPEMAALNIATTDLNDNENEKLLQLGTGSSLSSDHIDQSNSSREKIDRIKIAGNSDNNNPKNPNLRSANINNDSGKNNSERSERIDQEMSISFSATTTEGCPGTSIDFNIMNMPEGGRYLWNFGDGSFSNKPDPAHIFDKPGSYEVTLLITSVGDGSMSLEPARDLIVIHDAPYSDFSWELEANSNEIPVIHFENTSQNGVKWKWDLGDGTTSDVSHPEHVYKNKGIFNVTLTATNPMGCVDQVTRKVEVANDFKLLAPNTFSPNDDGINDLFIPEALKILNINFKMSIFEPKTGRLIYETAQVNDPWNGRVNNKGAACEKGEYVWVIDVKDGFNAQESYNGKVTLLR